MLNEEGKFERWFPTQYDTLSMFSQFVYFTAIVVGFYIPVVNFNAELANLPTHAVLIWTNMLIYVCIICPIYLLLVGIHYRHQLVQLWNRALWPIIFTQFVITAIVLICAIIYGIGFIFYALEWITADFIMLTGAAFCIAAYFFAFFIWAAAKYCATPEPLSQNNVQYVGFDTVV